MKNRAIWLTGLPCAGKTTIAQELVKLIPNSTILDGDIIRSGPLGQGVGFSKEDREAHIKRMGHIAKILLDSGITPICSFVSPSRETREEIKEFIGKDRFFEIFIDPPLEVCIKRDVKGMYAKAMRGEIQNFTGIDATYEKPTNPSLRIDTDKISLKDTVNFIVGKLKIYPERAAFFIGRWNGALHLGHEEIFNQELSKGKRIVLLIRNVRPDEKNPWTAKEVKEMLDYRYKDNDSVSTMIVPDLESVNYGRGVGYEVKEIKVSGKIAGISGTKCREMIQDNNPEWKKLVSHNVIEFLELKYSKENKK